MANVATQNFTRGQVQDLLATFAAENPNYRSALMKDPKAIIEQQFGLSLGNVTVQAVVETSDTAYLVLPYVPAEGELQDRDLEFVAGGKGGGDIDATCYTFGGSFNTVNQIAL